MKKLKIVILLCMILGVSGCKEKLGDIETIENISYRETDKKTNNVLIELEDDRKILIELYPDIAPKTVANFKSLVAKDFYDSSSY